MKSQNTAKRRTLQPRLLFVMFDTVIIGRNIMLLSTNVPMWVSQMFRKAHKTTQWHQFLITFFFFCMVFLITFRMENESILESLIWQVPLPESGSMHGRANSPNITSVAQEPSYKNKNLLGSSDIWVHLQ